MSIPVIPSSLDEQRVPLSRERVLTRRGGSRGCGRSQLADHALPRPAPGRQTDGPLLPRRQQERDHRRHRRSRLQRDRTALLRRRLANGDGTASEIGPSGTSSSPLGDHLLQSRTAPGPATLRHHDAIIGGLRRAGFSVAMTAHAYAFLTATSMALHCPRHRCRSTAPSPSLKLPARRRGIRHRGLPASARVFDGAHP